MSRGQLGPSPAGEEFQEGRPVFTHELKQNDDSRNALPRSLISSPALGFDQMERPKVDSGALALLKLEARHPADFTIGRMERCGLARGMAWRVVGLLTL
jgi:hypothetical protein